MKPKKYSLLYFHHLCDKYSKWIFPLHEGENIIGSDKNVDIFLYLNEIKDKIESIHCKIILDESQNNISIISLTDNGIVKLNNDDKIEILSPGKEYILKNKSVFYLGENLKFTLVYDTMDEIYKYFLGQRLENEYQKWKQLISFQESNTKINLNLNLQRKESLNKSNISNLSNNNNNNNNINNNINNNTNNNSLLYSNKKDVNRIGFNNFDEVPDDNWINDNENSENKNNLEFSPFKQINSQNQSQKDNYVKFSIDETPKISQEINMSENNNNKYINEIKDMFHSKEIKIKNEYNENLINSSNNISRENCDNNLPLFKNSNSLDILPYKSKNEEKNINKDEKTAKMIRELLGENNLEIIVNNTNFKKIKKLDLIYKKSNKAKIESGNFDIKFANKSNIFGEK